METSDIDYEIDVNELNFLETICEYNETRIYKALWRYQLVCVKEIPKSNNELMVLSKCIHPKITQFLGAGNNDTSVFAITEYMVFGNLREYVHCIEGFESIRKIALDVAIGLHYLHSRKPQRVLHRDLKPENILLNESGAKICDFGVSKLTKKTMENKQLATIIKHNSPQHTGEIGTYLWAAPEVLAFERYDHKADIYSFGLVLYFLVTKRNPFEEYRLHTVQLVYKKVHNTIELNIPEDCPWASIIARCVAHNPSERPDTETLINTL